MRRVIWIPIALAAGACSSVEYHDSTAAVDANPLCVSAPDHPDQPMSRDCIREQTATWSSERDREPVDFTDGDE